MLIVSKFHDYYDTALAWGVDKTVVYQRAESCREIKDTFDYLPAPAPHYTMKNTLSIACKVIGFCGKIYPILIVDLGVNKRKFVCYSTNEVVSALATEKMKLYDYPGFRSKYDFTEPNLNTYFNYAGSTLEADRFHKEKMPCFLIEIPTYRRVNSTKITLNPCLKKLEFYRIVDSYTAFQEITMYISGVLGVGNKDRPAPGTEMTNEQLRDCKGFFKGSFKHRKKEK